MRYINTFVVFVVCLFISFDQISGSISSRGEEKIIFSPEKVQSEATWSQNFIFNEQGLFSATATDVWIQSHPFPVGLSWRPPQGIRLTVSIDGSWQKSAEGNVYVRYSCDRKHWSEWKNLPIAHDKESKAILYKGNIDAPDTSVENYNLLMRQWWRTKPAWSSDEHDFCIWIAKSQPEFFEKEFPFIGYVQFRLELKSISKQLLIKSISAEYSWSVGGIHSIPDETKPQREDTDRKWFFNIGKVSK